MASSAQAKLEEREARKLLAASRAAKKEAAKKQRKHGSKKVSQEEPKKRYVPKSILILKSEVEPAAGEAPKKTEGSTGKKKGRNSGTGRPSASGVERPENAVEPPYSYEIHHKNKQVLVSVQLNKVPPQTIDCDATTSTTLIVQTPKFTKKYFLAFELPGGVKVDPKKSEFTYDTGVLKCVLPIVGDLPEEVVSERAALIEKFREQKALRFRMSKEGDLVVRSRRAVLKQTQEKATAAKSKRESSTEAPPVSSTTLSTSTEKAAAPKPSKIAPKSPKAETKGTKASPKPNPKKAPAPSQKPASAGPSTSAIKGKQFVADGEAMLSMASEAGKKQRNQLYAKLEQTKRIQQQRSERLTKREGRKNVTREKNEATFARVIAEQKAQLLQRAALAKPAPAKKATDQTKKVSFA